ncbi:PREDICTED: trypsin epsilon-like [Ceratosolen solmsi marchali]|uniref:Trypsin epsilon-like n=1 Tax=Ceratosolen solmsi marchali TaxID=326594 RepID=A0AAJ6YQB7_9HYME|nr:PREDICTED: trypsin epsilon-like [Ceratosolen solmsi marchali]
MKLFSADVVKLEDENIVGGIDAKIEDYKYQVVVLHLMKIWCGGSIITKKDVLTAGHCVRLSYRPLSIRAGSSFWFKGGSLHEVSSNFTYGQFQSTDIGILRLRQPFVFDNTRQPIPLANPKTVLKPGSLAVVSGWGTNDLHEYPDQLQIVKVPLVDKNICKKVFIGTSIGNVTDSQLCAGITSKDSCQGDSGSPLVYNGVQIGIVSKGIGCGLAKYPGIYSDVSYFYDWIMSTISADKE